MASLIQEARHLRRSQWAIGIGLLALLGAGIGLGAGMSGGSGRSGAGGQPGTHGPGLVPAVAMLNLSTSDKYGDIALIGQKIILYGPAIDEQDPSVQATCNSAVVDPATLALSHLMTSSCANPALQGRSVLPVVTVEPKTPSGNGGVARITVRISRVVPRSPGYELGPVVMSFPQESDGWPTWTYGDGDLWLFDALAKGGSQLLRISGRSGAVLQHIAMPAISRPIVAFDDDGFWLAPAVNSGGDDGTSNGVYYVAPGADAALRVLSLPRGEPVSWMVASGHSLWLAPGPAPTMVLHLVGASAKPIGHAMLAASFAGVLMTQGDSSTIVGDASGLWAAVPRAAGERQQVFRLLPDTGAVSAVALLEPAYSSPYDLLYGKTEAIAYHGSMYLLDPPAGSGPGYRSEGFSALYRITSASAATPGFLSPAGSATAGRRDPGVGAARPARSVDGTGRQGRKAIDSSTRRPSR